MCAVREGGCKRACTELDKPWKDRRSNRRRCSVRTDRGGGITMATELPRKLLPPRYNLLRQHISRSVLFLVVDKCVQY
jgi:hypothetical protein